MSFRIEQTDPLTLLSELPDQWAQTCVTSPRRDAPIPYLLAVLDEVHRVLRADGTLWLALTRGGCSHYLKAALKDTRWVQPRPASTIPRGVLLLTKQPDFPLSPTGPSEGRCALKALCVPGIPLRNGRGEAASAARGLAARGASRRPARRRGYRHER